MPFDFTNAIAKLDMKGLGYSDTPDFTQLRDKYPELGYLFNYAEDLAEGKDEEITKLADDYRELEMDVERLDDRLYDAQIATTVEAKNAAIKEARTWLTER